MPRKNFASKSARRQQHPELPVILPAFLADTTGEWAVEMTNGSGRKVITMHGTKSSVWDWAEKAGARGGIGKGYWYPVDLTSAANLVTGDDGSFLLVG